MQKSSFDAMHARLPLRLLCLFAAVSAASVLTSCGGGDPGPAPPPAPAPAPSPPPALPPAVVGSAAECFNSTLFTSGTRYRLNYLATNRAIGGNWELVVDGTVGAATTFEGVDGVIPVSETRTGSAGAQYPSTVLFDDVRYIKLEGREVLEFGAVVGSYFYVQGTTVFSLVKAVMTPARRDSRYTLMPGDEATSNFVYTASPVTAGIAPPFVQSRSSIVRYLGQESVTVPAGTFTACKFGTSGPAEWIIKGTGIVAKRVQTANTEELTSASINEAVVH